MSKVTYRGTIPGHVRQARIQQGKKLRAMYRSLGLSRAQCAQFLHVSERTLHNWESGTHAIPFAAFKLLRIHCYMELPGVAWRGWSLSHGKLCTPEGHELNPLDAAWWSLLVRRAETGARALGELARLRQQEESAAQGAQMASVRSSCAPGAAPVVQVQYPGQPAAGSWWHAAGLAPRICNTGGKQGNRWQSATTDDRGGKHENDDSTT